MGTTAEVADAEGGSERFGCALLPAWGAGHWANLDEAMRTGRLKWRNGLSPTERRGRRTRSDMRSGRKLYHGADGCCGIAADGAEVALNVLLSGSEMRQVFQRKGSEEQRGKILPDSVSAKDTLAYAQDDSHFLLRTSDD